MNPKPNLAYLKILNGTRRNLIPLEAEFEIRHMIIESGLLHRHDGYNLSINMKASICALHITRDVKCECIIPTGEGCYATVPVTIKYDEITFEKPKRWLRTPDRSRWIGRSERATYFAHITDKVTTTWTVAQPARR